MINERIKQLRKLLTLNQTEFAEKIGMSQNGVAWLEKPNYNITEQNFLLICKTFSVNPEWLRNGTGDIFIPDDKKFNEFFEIYKNLRVPLQEYLLKTANDLIELQDKL